jgi:hypothetical protein
MAGVETVCGGFPGSKLCRMTDTASHRHWHYSFTCSPITALRRPAKFQTACRSVSKGKR